MHAPRTTVALTFLLSGPAFAQGFTWTPYVSHRDYFSVSFPGEPSVREIAYPTEYRISLPGRVYSHEDGAYLFSVTVVDYSDAVDIHLARVESCQAAGGDGDICQDDGPEEMRGALVYASWNIMNRDGVEVTHYAHYNSDRIEGHAIRLTNADESRTSAVVHMHEDRLYVLESTAPRGAPAPGVFQISLQFLDDEYAPVRYEWQGTQLYSNGYPPPPRIR
ncbi:MAG TPA: hypothetical protein VGC50_11325 [Gammaproteobacteria bacterium]|jgi:hypothetical protein